MGDKAPWEPEKAVWVPDWVPDVAILVPAMAFATDVASEKVLAVMLAPTT